MKINFWSVKEDEELRRVYSEKASKAKVLATLTNRSYGAIKHRAKALGLRKTRLQHKNNNFFDAPNIENSCLAGILASDGCILMPKGKNSYRIVIGFNYKDKSTLSAIKIKTNCNANINETVRYEAVSPRNNIKYNGIYKFCFITFSDAKQWIADLSKHWNISHNKSLTIGRPNYLSMEESLAYLCGIISGDGTIGFQRAKNDKYLYIRMLGTKELLTWAKEIFEKSIRERLKGSILLERTGANIYKFQINGLQAIKIFNKINSLDCMKIERKWNNPEILSYISQKKMEFPEFFV